MNFKLVFRRYFEYDTGSYTGSDSFVRVIACEYQATAYKIAAAMVGEWVSYNECLTKVIKVTPTTDPPDMATWDHDAAWEHAFKNLGLEERPGLLQ